MSIPVGLFLPTSAGKEITTPLPKRSGKGVVIRLNDGTVWLRTNMNRSVYVPYNDISGNTISYDEAEFGGGSAYEWYNPFGDNYVSTDQLLTMAQDQTTKDIIENARNLVLPSEPDLTWLEKFLLWLKAGVLGFADNTYKIPWWVYTLLIIGFVLLIFKPFKRRRSK